MKDKIESLIENSDLDIEDRDNLINYMNEVTGFAEENGFTDIQRINPTIKT